MRVTAHQSSWQRYIREANAGKSIALQMPRTVQVSEKVSNQTILNRHQSRLKHDATLPIAPTAISGGTDLNKRRYPGRHFNSAQ